MKSILLMTCLLGLGLSVGPPEANAQVPTRDTSQAVLGSEPAPTDTKPPSPDTAAAASDNGAVTDTTARSDTTAASDTTEARDTASTRDTTEASDTTPARDTTQARDTAAARDTSAGPAASAEPVDSILSAACSGGVTVARDLLVIVFAPEAGDGERTAAADIVKGKLLGPVSSSEPGAYYLRVPGNGGEFGLRTASDELIRLAQVRQVGSRACPSTPAPQRTTP